VLDQRRLDRPGLLCCGVGQVGDRAADQGRVPVADRTLRDRGGDQRKLRRRRLTGQGAAWSQLHGQPHPPRRLPPADPQPLGQQHRRRRTPQLPCDSPRLQLGHQPIPDRAPPTGINLESTQQLQQLITAERGQVNITQLLPRSGEMAEREPNR